MTADPAFRAVTEFVEREMAFATSHYNDSYLQRRLASRMRRTRTESYEAYLQLLREDGSERQALLDALSINVTGFFRNPEVWEGMREALRSLVADGGRVRLWSAGCADGREPYSLSMLALDDPRIDASRVDVLATDINESALASARRGVYRSTKTVDLDDQLDFLTDYRQYVERDGDEFRIRDAVGERVTFEHHDLINGEPKRGFDVVVCRNLFIYIDPEYKRPIVETLTDALGERRHLVIGKAETLPPTCKDEFEVVDGRRRIYRKVR